MRACPKPSLSFSSQQPLSLCCLIPGTQHDSRAEIPRPIDPSQKAPSHTVPQPQ